MASRGRGRGKPATGAQLFLQRSAQESGLDGSNVKMLQDLTRPSLFPDMLWHSSGRGQAWVEEDKEAEIQTTKRSQSAIFLIKKTRELQHRMQSSPYFLNPRQEADVVRHRKRSRANGAYETQILEQMGPRVANSNYVPEELLTAEKSSKRTDGSSSPKKKVTLDEIAKQEAKRGGSDEEADDDDIVSLEPDDGEDEEAIDDYITNYYASEDESDGGGGGGGGEAEPTF